MDLFNTEEIANILPSDGTVNYHGKIMSHDKAQYFLEKLFTNIEWKNDEAILFGKHFVTKRKIAWYGDQAFDYTYSNTTKRALLWTKELLELKTVVENLLDTTFNSCLLNLYHDGDEGMAWHSDDEKVVQAACTRKSCFVGYVK
jgi:alkylated DNA repair dioxygenase AlkB